MENPHIHCPKCDLEMQMIFPKEFIWFNDFRCGKCGLEFLQNGNHEKAIQEWFWKNEDNKKELSGSSPEECVRAFKLRLFQ